MQVNCEVEFVESARHVDEIAEVTDDAFAIAREQPRSLA